MAFSSAAKLKIVNAGGCNIRALKSLLSIPHNVERDARYLLDSLLGLDERAHGVIFNNSNLKDGYASFLENLSCFLSRSSTHDNNPLGA